MICEKPQLNGTTQFSRCSQENEENEERVSFVRRTFYVRKSRQCDNIICPENISFPNTVIKWMGTHKRKNKWKKKICILQTNHYINVNTEILSRPQRFFLSAVHRDSFNTEILSRPQRFLPPRHYCCCYCCSLRKCQKKRKKFKPAITLPFLLPFLATH